MIDLMKKSVLALFLGLLLVSCSENEPEPEVDVREQAVGTYDVTITITLSDDSEISETTEMTVAKDGENGLRFTVEGESEDLIGIVQAGNGIGFNYPNTIETDDEGDDYQLSGTQRFTMGDSNYDGRFISDSKEFELEVSAEYLDEQYSQYNYTVYFRGFKK